MPVFVLIFQFKIVATYLGLWHNSVEDLIGMDLLKHLIELGHVKSITERNKCTKLHQVGLKDTYFSQEKSTHVCQQRALLYLAFKASNWTSSWETSNQRSGCGWVREYLEASEDERAEQRPVAHHANADDLPLLWLFIPFLFIIKCFSPKRRVEQPSSV